MGHFSEQAWADFARGFTGAEQARGIHAHIASGCLSCKSTHYFWSRIQNMALAERTYSVPENLVRLATLEFTAKQMRAERCTNASLIFDSLSRPLLAGVRGGDAVARHLVYEAEGLTIDLRFDRGPQSGNISVIGQILDSWTPDDILTGGSVVVWTENGHLVATTTANSYGEFQVEFDACNDLRLTVSAGGRNVRVPLVNLT